MFERYTERARRVIFFARYEASQFGSTTTNLVYSQTLPYRGPREPARDLEA